MNQIYSINQVMSKKFQTISLPDQLEAATGRPEPNGTWFIYGEPKQGKTSLAFQISRILADSRKVLYNSIEEGLSKSIQNAIVRSRIDELKTGFQLAQLEWMALTKLLRKKKAPQVVIIDSIQFAGLTFNDYRNVKIAHPDKLFIFISHVFGKLPEGNTARHIWRDASVIFRVEHFKAFVTSRFGGGEPYVINDELANKYWI